MVMRQTSLALNVTQTQLILNENGSTHSNFAHHFHRYNGGNRRIANSTKCTDHYCIETIRQDKCLMLKDHELSMVLC